MQEAAFFDEITNELRAYWFGFLNADGCIFRGGRQCAVTLAARDEGHLSQFAAIFGRPVWRTEVRDGRTGRTYERVRCVLNSKALCSALRHHGFRDGRRPLELVPKPHLHHFIRGYFDGDGYVGVVAGNQWRVAFVGERDFLCGLRNLLHERLGLRVTAVRRDGAIHRLAWGGAWQLVRIRDFLYSEASIFLERKRERFARLPEQRGTSRYVGVYRPQGRTKWVARIYAEGKTRHIASCDSEEAAALAYDAAARRYYGADAIQNFPRDTNHAERRFS